MSEESAPQAAFLGFAERATQIRDAGTDVVKWNVLGLKSILLTHFFSLRSKWLAFCLCDAGYRHLQR
jgi:hypothetical protein